MPQFIYCSDAHKEVPEQEVNSMNSSFPRLPGRVWYSSVAVQAVIDRFINGIIEEVRAWQGQDSLCVVGIEPDGPFYAEPLARALDAASFTSMSERGAVDDDEALKGRKVLLVDNDIVTGSTYRRAIASIKRRVLALMIKEVRYAVLDDRKGLADFAARRPIGALEASQLLGIDRSTLSRLCQRGSIPGVTRKGRRWMLDARALEDFKGTYIPRPGRPRKTAQ